MTEAVMQVLSSYSESSILAEPHRYIRRGSKGMPLPTPEREVALWHAAVDALAWMDIAWMDRLLLESRRMSKNRRIHLPISELDLPPLQYVAVDAQASVHTILDYYLHVLSSSYGQVAEMGSSVYSLFRFQLGTAALCGVLCALALADLVVWFTTGVTAFDPVLDLAVVVAAAGLFASTYLSLVHLAKKDPDRV